MVVKLQRSGIIFHSEGHTLVSIQNPLFSAVGCSAAGPLLMCLLLQMRKHFAEKSPACFAWDFSLFRLKCLSPDSRLFKQNGWVFLSAKRVESGSLSSSYKEKTC